jgi:hypothetical protein
MAVVLQAPQRPAFTENPLPSITHLHGKRVDALEQDRIGCCAHHLRAMLVTASRR